MRAAGRCLSRESSRVGSPRESAPPHPATVEHVDCGAKQTDWHRLRAGPYLWGTICAGQYCFQYPSDTTRLSSGLSGIDSREPRCAQLAAELSRLSRNEGTRRVTLKLPPAPQPFALHVRRTFPRWASFRLFYEPRPMPEQSRRSDSESLPSTNR